MRQITFQEMAAPDFAQFGVLIDAALAAPEHINDGSTRRYPDLARLDLRGGDGDPVIGIYEASARRFPLTIAKLERHRNASQVFLPLGSQRFIVVVAPSAPQTGLPDWERITAFLTRPGQGVSLHRGTWHHGLVALADGDRFAVIEGGGYRADTEERDAPQGIALSGPAGPL